MACVFYTTHITWYAVKIYSIYTDRKVEAVCQCFAMFCDVLFIPSKRILDILNWSFLVFYLNILDWIIHFISLNSKFFTYIFFVIESSLFWSFEMVSAFLVSIYVIMKFHNRKKKFHWTLLFLLRIFYGKNGIKPNNPLIVSQKR